MADIVTGKARFVHDLEMPDMLHARVVRPPHYRARLRDLDAAVCRRLGEAGAHVVRDGSFLAVAGEDEYADIKTAERLAAVAQWETGAGLGTGDIYERLRTNPRVSLPVVDGTPQKDPVPAPADPPTGATHNPAPRFPRHLQLTGLNGTSVQRTQWVT